MTQINALPGFSIGNPTQYDAADRYVQSINIPNGNLETQYNAQNASVYDRNMDQSSQIPYTNTPKVNASSIRNSMPGISNEPRYRSIPRRAHDEYGDRYDRRREDYDDYDRHYQEEYKHEDDYNMRETRDEYTDRDDDYSSSSYNHDSRYKKMSSDDIEGKSPVTTPKQSIPNVMGIPTSTALSTAPMSSMATAPSPVITYTARPPTCHDVKEHLTECYSCKSGKTSSYFMYVLIIIIVVGLGYIVYVSVFKKSGSSSPPSIPSTPTPTFTHSMNMDPDDF